MKKLLGILLATLAMFVFGAVYWMTPLTTSWYQSATDDETAGRRLKELFPASGAYLLPSTKAAPEQRLERLRTGPLAVIHVDYERKLAGEPDPRTLGLGFAHELISVALAAVVMGSLLGVLTTYVCRVGFMTILGVFIAWFGPVGQSIWWLHAWPVQVMEAIYIVLAWLVSGLVLAAFIKPAGEAAK